MKLTRKVLALILALVMVMGLATTAFAADTHTLTINNSVDDHTYEAYQIFSGVLAEKDGKQILSDIEWGTGVKGDALLTEIN